MGTIWQPPDGAHQSLFCNDILSLADFLGKRKTDRRTNDRVTQSLPVPYVIKLLWRVPPRVKTGKLYKWPSLVFSRLLAGCYFAPYWAFRLVRSVDPFRTRDPGWANAIRDLGGVE